MRSIERTHQRIGGNPAMPSKRTFTSAPRVG